MITNRNGNLLDSTLGRDNRGRRRIHRLHAIISSAHLYLFLNPKEEKRPKNLPSSPKFRQSRIEFGEDSSIPFWEAKQPAFPRLFPLPPPRRKSSPSSSGRLHFVVRRRGRAARKPQPAVRTWQHASTHARMRPARSEREGGESLAFTMRCPLSKAM
ncbi:hypothetical protein BHM03_00025462 [Ensete ventricosum]|nr:hypothetical protein BHM03_00025462 [Ensete ventricosum]